MSEEVVTLDVREDLRRGREPFSRIMEAVAGLTGSQSLRLIAPIEPVPLFRVMQRKGFAHAAKQMDSGDWEVLFFPGAAASEAGKNLDEPSQSSLPGKDTVEVDARGLEPPQPLVRILEAVAKLPPGGTLRARTDRRPMHLYAQLLERGFGGESEEQSDGTFVTHIRRA